MSGADCTTEEWRPVVGWEKLYAVSSHGRIMRVSDSRFRIQGSFCKVTEWKPIRSLTTYGCVRLSKTGMKSRKVFSVHRLVATAFIGNPDGRVINHIDGNGMNNHVGNLEICTYATNSFHARRVLKRALGEASGVSKITNRKAREIKSLLSSGVPGHKIAKMFGLHRNTVSDIKIERIWKHISIH